MKISNTRIVSVVQLLEQDEYWAPNGKDELIRLVDMSPHHRANLLAYLRRRAHGLNFKVFQYYFMRLRPSGDMANDAFDMAADEFNREDPKRWIERQPLVIKLCELVRLDRKAALREVARTPAWPTWRARSM